jgi:hypothetical protein
MGVRTRGLSFLPEIPIDAPAWMQAWMVAITKIVQDIVGDETTPGQPGNLTATNKNTGVLLQWTQAPNAAAYRVYRNSTGVLSTATLIEELVGINNISYLDTIEQSVADAKRFYWVVARNHSGDIGPYSGMVSSTNYSNASTGVAVGTAASASGENTVAVGPSANASGSGSTVVGKSSTDAGYDGVVIVGNSVTATEDNEVLIGGRIRVDAAGDLYVDSVAVSSSPGVDGISVETSLPSLPDADYPQGKVVFLTSDAKLYRNTDGSTWSKAADGGDLLANSVTANELNVSQLSAISADLGTATAGTLTLSSSGHIKSGQTAYDNGTGFFPWG